MEKGADLTFYGSQVSWSASWEIQFLHFVSKSSKLASVCSHHPSEKIFSKEDKIPLP